MKDEYEDMYDLCKQHMHSYVLAEAQDGTQVDGIITGVDSDYVYMAVPVNESEQYQMAEERGYDERQFGFGSSFYNHGYGNHYGNYSGGPGYGHGGYGYGGYPRRRFNRLVLPLAALTALSILPWY